MKRKFVLVLCGIGISGALFVGRAQTAPATQSQVAPLDMSAFKLDPYLKARGFVAEKAPVKTFGSLSGQPSDAVPTLNQRWFHGNDCIEASIVVFKNEKEVRRFDKDFLSGHQLPPVSPFSCPVVKGVRDNASAPTGFRGTFAPPSFIYNLVAVGRTYIVIEAVQFPTGTPKPLSSKDFVRVVQGVKRKLIAAARKIPNLQP